MKYASLDDMRYAQKALKNERDAYGENLALRWKNIREPEFRKALMKDAIDDVLESWKPYRIVHDLLQGNVNGSAITSVGMFVASLQKSWPKRILYTGISALIGKLFGDTEGSTEHESSDNLLHKLAKAVGSLVQRFSNRDRVHEEEEEPKEEVVVMH